jgi:hypothetical protein
MLGDEGQDEVGRDRRDLLDARLAPTAFHVVFARIAEAPVRLHAGFRGVPCCLGGQQLRNVGVARILGVEPGSPGLFIRRYYLGQGGRLLSVSLNVYPVDRFEFATSWKLAE